jgi:hypothetical protein
MNEKKLNVKRIVLILLSIILLTVITNYAPALYHHNFLNIKKTLWVKSVFSDFQNGKFEKYHKITMTDSSWIVFAMEHECCSGGGFNCIISKDSAGKVKMNSEKCFCGYEELGSKLSAISSESTSIFYSELDSIGLKMTARN